MVSGSKNLEAELVRLSGGEDRVPSAPGLVRDKAFASSSSNAHCHRGKDRWREGGRDTDSGAEKERERDGKGRQRIGGRRMPCNTIRHPLDSIHYIHNPVVTWQGKGIKTQVCARTRDSSLAGQFQYR